MGVRRVLSAKTYPARSVTRPRATISDLSLISGDSEIYDYDATLPILFGRFGLVGRLRNVER
jgi:hypothetical protein